MTSTAKMFYEKHVKYVYGLILALMICACCCVSVKGQSSLYRQYYSDPAHLGCAKVEICGDTTIIADCYDDACFNEQEWIPIQRYGPYLWGDNSVFYPHTGVLVHYDHIRELPSEPVTATFNGNPELIKLLQTSPPINLKVKEVAIMIEPSKAPLLSAYFGQGPIYTFLVGERAFDNGAGSYFKAIQGITTEDVLKSLNDYFQPYE